MPEYVYFVEGAGLVKIGWAKDPKKRLANLQIGSPVKLFLIGMIETEKALPLEAALHKRFRRHRVYGEWFEFSHAIRAYIQSQACTAFLTSARVSRDLAEKSVLSALTRDWQGKTALSAATGRRAYMKGLDDALNELIQDGLVESHRIKLLHNGQRVTQFRLTPKGQNAHGIQNHDYPLPTGT